MLAMCWFGFIANLTKLQSSGKKEPQLTQSIRLACAGIFLISGLCGRGLLCGQGHPEAGGPCFLRKQTEQVMRTSQWVAFLLDLCFSSYPDFRE